LLAQVQAATVLPPDNHFEYALCGLSTDAMGCCIWLSAQPNGYSVSSFNKAGWIFRLAAAMVFP